LKIVCFGDNWGAPMLCRNLPSESIAGIVGAEIRPQYHHELKTLAESLLVDFLIQPTKMSPGYPGFLESIRGLALDFIFVNSYSMLLHTDLLAIPTRGAINIHGGLLPGYRGCNPTQWALLNDEKETGVTIHYMDADFDSGDIIAQQKVPILEEDTWIDIQKRIDSASEELFANTIYEILSGTNSRVRQEESMAHYWRRRTPEDGQFSWTWRAREIYNLVRALVKPHPGAFYYNEGGEKVVLNSFIPLDEIKELQAARVGHAIE